MEKIRFQKPWKPEKNCAPFWYSYSYTCTLNCLYFCCTSMITFTRYASDNLVNHEKIWEKSRNFASQFLWMDTMHKNICRVGQAFWERLINQGRVRNKSEEGGGGGKPIILKANSPNIDIEDYDQICGLFIYYYCIMLIILHYIWVTFYRFLNVVYVMCLYCTYPGAKLVVYVHICMLMIV